MKQAAKRPAHLRVDLATWMMTATVQRTSAATGRTPSTRKSRNSLSSSRSDIPNAFRLNNRTAVRLGFSPTREPALDVERDEDRWHSYASYFSWLRRLRWRNTPPVWLSALAWVKATYQTNQVVAAVIQEEDDETDRYLALIAAANQSGWQAAEVWLEDGSVATINDLGEGLPPDDLAWPW